MSKILRSFDWRVAVALGGTYVFFGSGPAATAAGIQTLPPFLMVAFRGLLAGTILTTWALAAGARWPNWREWRAGAVMGVLILACGAGGGTYGQLTVPSGVAGVLSALLPLFAAIIGYVVFRERLPKRAIAGLLIGFAGIALLLRPGSGFDLFGVMVIVFGQVAWAIGAELGPRIALPEEPRMAAGVELLAGGTVMLVAASLLGDWGRLNLHEVTAISWAGFGWFVVIAVGGFTAFGFLTQTVAPSVATTFSYVNPVVAMTLGWLLFSEPITWRMVIATGVIVVGVCLIVSTKSQAPGKPKPVPRQGHRADDRRVLEAPGN